MVTIESVMRSCNNFFDRGSKHGTFTIRAGRLTDTSLPAKAPYIAIHGSAFHDGVHSTEKVLEGPDETFDGTVWILCPDPSFTNIVERISAYDDAAPIDGKMSESFGEYSYTRGAGALGPMTWQEAFREELRPYWRQFTEVTC